ncbi:MAG TPA: transglutaminase-like domain-containing protein, partial [Candidatus Limnocylindrales bacterium]|nr:transglutaminase-like domain-containing protein [Candidatus Limnocylindrales bacterium]
MTERRDRIDDARVATRARFARLVARPEADIDLAVAALVIAAHGRSAPDEDAVLDHLDHLAQRARIRLDEGDPIDEVVDRLHDVLYREVGYRGPTAAEYADPANSLLDAVVERRIGLPISLAIVELETAWRLGLPLVGIGLPGLFIVGGPDGLLT